MAAFDKRRHWNTLKFGYFCVSKSKSQYHFSMKKLLFALVLIAVAVQASYAQQAGVCGTTFEDQRSMDAAFEEARMIAQQIVAQDRSGVTQYVPIHFHLVADADGNGRHREVRVLDQMCDLNESYASQDVRFYLRPHNTYGMFDKSINHDNVYDNQTNTFLMQNRRHPNALNVYVCNAAATSNNQPGTTLAYYSPTQDWVVSRKDQVNGSGNGTLPHEIGHFFSLRHTFYGWESDPNDDTNPGFDPGDPTWPVAPALSPLGPATERVNGTNCLAASDGICDTPPDYNFGFAWNGCTTYNQGAQDPLGQLVNPMENNFMGYFIGCTNYMFTDGQIAQIAGNLASSGRNYLDNTFVPVADTVETPTDLLIYPTGGTTTPFYNDVDFSWNAAPGATHYILELDKSSSFILASYRAFTVEGTSFQLNDLAPNTTYYWRLRPFNQYYTCTTFRQGSFKTSNATTGVVDIATLTDMKLIPNPVESGSTARLSVDAITNFEGTVQVLDAAGKLVRDLGTIQFTEGNNAVEIELENQANGMYFVTLTSAQGRRTERLAVVR